MVTRKETASAAAIYYRKNYKRMLLMGIERRAKAKGIPFDLKPEDIEIPKTCPVLGIPLVVGGARCGPTDNSPSVDRIDNDLGYIRGNVVVVSFRVNRIKYTATPEELRKVADFYEALAF